MRYIPATALAALLLSGTGAGAHEFTLGALTIEHPYATETTATARSGAGYMTIDNAGPDADVLVAIRADVPRVEVHATETDAQGVARMRPVGALEIPAGGSVTLAPRGLHVMFMGLPAPFVAGERIPATLVFEKAGEVAVEFAVEPRDAGAPDHAGDH